VLLRLLLPAQALQQQLGRLLLQQPVQLHAV
jgi:hypothetical protein